MAFHYEEANALYEKSKPDYSNLPVGLFQTTQFLLDLHTFLTRYFFQYAFPWNQNETLVFIFS